MVSTLEPGSTWPMWITVRDRAGEDISSATVRLAVTPDRSHPETEDWAPPVTPPAPPPGEPGSLRARLLVTDAQPGRWTVWAEVTIDDREAIVNCGSFVVKQPRTVTAT